MQKAVALSPVTSSVDLPNPLPLTKTKFFKCEKYLTPIMNQSCRYPLPTIMLIRSELNPALQAFKPATLPS
jgi:hypothetical protein